MKSSSHWSSPDSFGSRKKVQRIGPHDRIATGYEPKRPVRVGEVHPHLRLLAAMSGLAQRRRRASRAQGERLRNPADQRGRLRVEAADEKLNTLIAEERQARLGHLPRCLEMLAPNCSSSRASGRGAPSAAGEGGRDGSDLMPADHGWHETAKHSLEVLQRAFGPEPFGALPPACTWSSWSSCPRQRSWRLCMEGMGLCLVWGSKLIAQICSTKGTPASGVGTICDCNSPTSSSTRKEFVFER